LPAILIVAYSQQFISPKVPAPARAPPADDVQLQCVGSGVTVAAVFGRACTSCVVSVCHTPVDPRRFAVSEVGARRSGGEGQLKGLYRFLNNDEVSFEALL
jgi:hypothetical protein